MLLILPAVVALALILVFWRRQKALTALRREAHIRNFTLPPRLFEPLRTQHPHLNLKDCQLVAQGLRQFFLAYLKSGQRYVSMPSQVVDDLWHEFILHTRDYQQFCNQASASSSTTPRRRCSARTPRNKATTACAGSGARPAWKRTSTRPSPAACHCCSPWTPS